VLSRRDVLRSSVAVTGTAAARRLLPREAQVATPPSAGTFASGVASGDPTSDAVVLWTRVGSGDGEVAVGWAVARDEAFTDVVRSGQATASPARDHTVHVDVTGLAAGTTWWYRFEALGARSPTGRTRTMAAADDPAEVRLGVVSCASYAAGPFTAYRHLAETDVDLVVHLGDYLYDAGEGPRSHDPAADPTTLADYRRRHAQQRSDPDLQALHAAAPMAAVWDDHDVAGNAWRGGAPGHDPHVDGPWEERRAAALQAWREWLPVRSPDPARPERIWRELRLGGVADLLLLDTRHDGRERQLRPDDPDGLEAPRALLSEEQHAWLGERLAGSRAPWRVLANQVVLTPLAYAVPDVLAGAAAGLGVSVDGMVVNPDAWDGYPAERSRLLAALAAAGPSVVLTGDVHSSWAFEVAAPDGTPLTVEWVTPSITSPPFADIIGLPAPSLAGAVVDRLARQLPQVRWAEITSHGYLVVALDGERAQADWWHVDLERGDAALAASWSVDRAEAVLAEAEPLPPRATPTTGSTPPTTARTDRPAPEAAAGDGDGDGGLGAGAVAGIGAAIAGAAAVAVGVRRRRAR
jgi:alkaline phosphatase D